VSGQHEKQVGEIFGVSESYTYISGSEVALKGEVIGLPRPGR